jgi:hypothetical protein
MYQPAKVYKIKHLHKIEVAQNDPSGCTFVLVCHFPVLQNKYQKINGSREFFFLDRALCPFFIKKKLGRNITMWSCRGGEEPSREDHRRPSYWVHTSFITS